MIITDAVMARHWLRFASVGHPALLHNTPVLATGTHVNPLRHYQFEIVQEVARLMVLGYRRILIQLPTGGGKTEIAKAMIASTLGQRLRSDFLVHRKELIDQTSESFTRSGLHHGFIASGRDLDFDADVTIAGVQTLVRRLDFYLPSNLVVIDEAHHATAGTWAQILASLPADAFIVGLSASPQRLDGRGLSDNFDIMVRGPSVAWLIGEGYLSPFDYYAPSIPDLSKAKTTAGDFNRSDLSDIMDRPALIGDIVQHYHQTAKGEPGLIFAASREHSRHLQDAFTGEGVRAAHVDGDTPTDERTRIMAAYRSRDIDILLNVDLFGEGVDVPGAVYLGMARPSKSLALVTQQWGRVLRPAYHPDMPLGDADERVAAIAVGPKRAAIINDHAGNCFRFGLPDDERDWTLEGKQKRAGKSSDDAQSVKQCKTCFRVVYSTVRTCPSCEAVFPVQVRKVETRDGVLTKIEREELKRRNANTRKDEERKCKTHSDFVALAKARGYPKPIGWATMKMKLRTSWRTS